MAWEQRGSNSYYYRSERLAGRVRKVYFGCGEVAGAVATLDRLDRMRARYARDCHQEASQERAARFAPVHRACDQAAALAYLLVQAAGYHRHDRGRWRKRRMQKQLAASDQAGLIPATNAEKLDVIQKAIMGKGQDKKLEARALAIIKADPDFHVTGYLREIERAVDAVSHGQEVLRALLLAEAERMRQGLYEGRAKEAIPYAEKLLIERVIACRFDVADAEGAYHRRFGKETSCPIVKAEHLQRNVDRAQSRYLKAIKALAEVKRLQLPMLNVALPGAVQINNGDKQITWP